jgi:excisionase family DNA binding protein
VFVPGHDAETGDDHLILMTGNSRHAAEGDPMDKQLLRVSEAAQTLNVSRWTIYRWVEEDRLKATKIGKGSLRIFRDSIDALIQQNRKDHWDLALTECR